MKLIKRILAIVLLCLTVAVIGYLVYTGSRLTASVYDREKIQSEVIYDEAI